MLMIYICITFRTLNYGNYGLVLIMGNAGFIPSTVVLDCLRSLSHEERAGLGGGASMIVGCMAPNVNILLRIKNLHYLKGPKLYALFWVMQDLYHQPYSSS